MTRPTVSGNRKSFLKETKSKKYVVIVGTSEKYSKGDALGNVSHTFILLIMPQLRVLILYFVKRYQVFPLKVSSA